MNVVVKKINSYGDSHLNTQRNSKSIKLPFCTTNFDYYTQGLSTYLNIEIASKCVHVLAFSY